MANTLPSKIYFQDNFGLILLKFFQYFSLGMFITGCLMVFLSLEKSKILPFSLLGLGIFIVVFLIAEKNIFSAGNTEVDLTDLVARKRYFFLKKHSFDLRSVDYFIIESVRTNYRVLIYNIFATVRGQKIPLGQERDFSSLIDKLNMIRRVVSCEIVEETRYLESVPRPAIPKLLFMLVPVFALLFFVFVPKIAAGAHKVKFLVVIFIPMSYFILHYFMRSIRKK